MKSNLGFLFCAAVLSISLAGCSPKSRAVQTYKKAGVQFSYYSDWSVEKDAPVDGKPDVRSIRLKGPDHAIVTIICVPPSSPQTLEQFAEAVAVRRKTKIEDKLSLGSLKTASVDKGTSEPVVGKVGGHDESGLHQQYSIEMLGQKVPHDVMFFMLRGAKYKVMIMSQVIQSRLEASRPAIELILDSLRIEGSP